MDRFVIPLSNGYRLIAERNTGEYDKELYVGIENSTGAYVQDLVIVRPTYKFEDDNVKFDSDKFEVLVFGKESGDDYTESFTIGLRKDDE